MPSKLLIAAAEAKHHSDHATVFGVRHEVEAQVDGPAVLKRVQDERDRFVGFVVRAVDEIPDEQKIRGWASFSGPGRLQVALEGGGEMHIKARAVVVAAGTEVWTPPPFRGLGDRLLSNESIFELKDLPTSVAVAGSGVIALELGQALSRLGVRVTFLNRSRRVGPVRDPRMLLLAREIFDRELDLQLAVSEIQAARQADGKGVELSWKDERGETREAQFEYVLSAAGRRPNLKRLGIERAGVEIGEDGLPTFDPQSMQVADSAVFLAGDLTMERALLHEAAEEGRIAGENAARFPATTRHARHTRLAIVFSDPNMATVGLPFRDIDTGRHACGEVDYSDQGRSRVMAQNRGAVRIWGEIDSGRLVGAEMIGPRVEHTAHLLAWAIQQDMTVDRALEMPFYHPVIEEGIRTALRNLAHAIKHTDATRPEFEPGD
jgi:dihydrolipoamide dehydrogenase